jgi:hypothetical protein
MIISNIASTMRFIRELRTADLRNMAQGYADDMLGRYGYSRGPSVAVQVLTHLGAFGAGMAVGTGLGLIVAPQSGAETRDRISRSFEGAVNKVKAKVGRSNGHIVTDDVAIRHAT